MEKDPYKCERCGIKISEDEHDEYDGLCEECHEIEVDELDYEEDYY